MLELIYDLVYMIPVCIIGMLMGAAEFNSPEKLHITILAAIISPLLIAGIRHVKKRFKLLIIGIPAVLGISAVMMVQPGQRTQFVVDNRWIGAVIVLGILSYVATQIVSANKWIRRVVGVAITFALGHELFRGAKLDKIVVAMLLLLIMVLVVEEIQQTWEKSGYTGAKEHLAGIAPLLIVISIVVCAVPLPDKPFDWSFASGAWEAIVDSVSYISSTLFHGSEEYSKMGFSEKGSIGAGIENSNKDVLEISGGRDGADYLYLVGKYFDSFDGKEWTTKATGCEHIRMFDSLETQCAVTQNVKTGLQDYFTKTNLTVEYKTYNTSYMFMPAKSILKKNALPDFVFNETQEGVLSEKALSYGSNYEISFMSINGQNPGVVEIMEKQAPIQEKTWKKTIAVYGITSDSDYSYEKYQQYRKSMKAQYSQEVQISDTLQKQLDELYEGAESDLEKMQRLSEWLRSYTYNTKPGKMPESVQSPQQYLDYFLLQKGEGYCVHFATAFTLLARAEGLPARMVQGYCVPRSRQKTELVTSDMAHDWAEVYFVNVGWITFEATPGFTYGTGWAIDKPEEITKPVIEKPVIEEPVQEDEGLVINPLMIILPVLCAIIFLAIYLVVNRLINKHNYNRMNNNDKAVTLSRKAITNLARIHMPMKPGETLMEYKARISEDFEGEMLDFIDCYEWLSYSKIEISDQQIDDLEKSVSALTQNIRQRKFIYKLLITS